MVRCQSFLVVLGLLCWATVAGAQDGVGAGAGTVEVGFVPGGGTFFVGGNDDDEVNFNTYDLAGTFSYYLSRLIGVEGEFSYGIGMAQDVFQKNRFVEHTFVPNTIGLHGNVLVYPGGADGRWVPYLTGGFGMLTLRTRGAATDTLGLPDPETYLAPNFGGGFKLLRGGTGFGAWGIRADYRIFTVAADDNATNEFFANQSRRTGHRFYFGFNWIVAR